MSSTPDPAIRLTPCQPRPNEPKPAQPDVRVNRFVFSTARRSSLLSSSLFSNPTAQPRTNSYSIIRVLMTINGTTTQRNRQSVTHSHHQQQPPGLKPREDNKRKKGEKEKLTPHNHPHTRNQIDNLGLDAQIGALAEAAVTTGSQANCINVSLPLCNPVLCILMFRVQFPFVQQTLVHCWRVWSSLTQLTGPRERKEKGKTYGERETGLPRGWQPR